MVAVLTHPRAGLIVRYAIEDVLMAVLYPALAAVILLVYVPAMAISHLVESVFMVMFSVIRACGRWLESAIMFAFDAPGRIIQRKTSAAIIECTCGLTSLAFTGWLLFGVGSPGLRILMLEAAPLAVWVWGSLALGLLQYAAPFVLPQNVRAVIAAIVVGVWFAFLGWLNQKGGASILHFCGAPLWMALLISVFILREPHREGPGNGSTSNGNHQHK